MWWKKKLKFKTVELVKEVNLKSSGYETNYLVRCDGNYVSGSISSRRTEAESFFKKYLELKGVTNITEVLLQEKI